MSDAILSAEGIYTGYDGSEVLHGVDLEVGRGEVVGVVGSNGAGKSTLFKAVFGVLDVYEGRVSYDGDDVTGAAPRDLLRRGMAYVPQGRSTFPEMSVEENLEMSAYLKDDVADALEAVYDRFPPLREKRADKAKTLSGGQQQMLEMGGALMMEPDLLLLDEPSMGLAPKITADIFERIASLNDEGVSFLVIEQNARRALRASDRAYVMDQGDVVLSGPSDELLENRDVERLYLGGRPGDGEGETTGGDDTTDGGDGGDGSDADRGGEATG